MHGFGGTEGKTENVAKGEEESLMALMMNAELLLWTSGDRSFGLESQLCLLQALSPVCQFSCL